MKRAFLAVLLLAFAAPACAAPVHVMLKATAAVAPDAAGFFPLGSVANLSGGDNGARARMASVPVGRVPVLGATRLLTGGDVCLKLRQAGFHPDTDALVGGAAQAAVTAAPSSRPETARDLNPLLPSPLPLVGGPLIHPGDAVTILVQSGPLTVTARGVAREIGRAGDPIRVHREGVMTDLTVTVVDAQTVQLEM